MNKPSYLKRFDKIKSIEECDEILLKKSIRFKGTRNKKLKHTLMEMIDYLLDIRLELKNKV